jgi:tetratricopeptide (TPR) repeat protein
MTILDNIFINACRTFQGDEHVSVTAKKLQSFLQATNSLAITRSERLRQLAIHLRYEKFEEGWQGIRQIFLAAAQEEPSDWMVHHSWGIAALDYSKDWHESDKVKRLAAATEGAHILNHALDLYPANSDIAYTLGLLHYNHPLFDEDRKHYLKAALYWFTQAIEWNPDNDIARLYKAHCHHDMEEWQAAIEAYSTVDQHRFIIEWPKWRTIKLREQLAYCYAKAGDLEEARCRFTDFLDYVEKLDEEGFEEEIVNFDELMMAATEILDSPALLNRARQLALRTGFEKRYQSL